MAVGGCKQISSSDSAQSQKTAGAPAERPLPNAYARHFALRAGPGYTVLTLTYASGAQADYVLADSGARVPARLATLPRIEVPVRRLAALSSTHLALLDALGSLPALVAVDQAKYVYNPAVHEALAAGRVLEAGDGAGGISAEALLAARPGLTLPSSGGSPTADAHPQLARLELPVLPTLDWLEAHPLGRAEWLRVLGALLGRAPQADSLFAQIKNSYERLADSLRRTAPRPAPRVLLGRSYRGTWYVPAGGSYAARLLADAGAAYPWAHTQGGGSLPLGLEAVLAEAGGAQLWLNTDDFTSRAALAQAEPRHARVAAFATGAVYSYMARATPVGGNDFWEAGTLRPDWVLADVAALVRAPQAPGPLRFYRKLGS